MLRRTPESILTALKMDSERCELYVEGIRDRIFLTWVAEPPERKNTLVLPIDSVELSDSFTGGNRGRLMAFAQFVPPDQERIIFFADADFDRLVKREPPPLLWLTDNRDLEGYVFTVHCIDRVLRLGLGIENPSSDKVFTKIKNFGRRLGLLRLLSEKQRMNLPFQKADLRRCLRKSGDELELYFDRYLKSLLQNANLKLSELENIKRLLDELTSEFESTADSEIIHGKDVMCIFQKYLEVVYDNKINGESLLWCSFEREMIDQFSTLKKVAEYIRNGIVQ